MSDALPDMKPITALGGQTPRIDTHGPVTLSENPDTALASFASRRGEEDAAQKALSAHVSLTLPEPGRMAENDAFCVFWMGPDQWMIMAPHESHESLATEVHASAEGAASVTEQNDAWCRFDLMGQGLAWVFERLCPINIRTATGGEATRTSIVHLGCFVLVRSREEITIFGPRSSAGSLHHALLTAMKSAH